MTLATLLDKKAARIGIGVAVGIPVTFVAFPVALFMGLPVGVMVLNNDLSSSAFFGFLLILIVTVFGLLGLAGAWMRLAETTASLSSRPRLRRIIVVFIGLGILNAGCLALIAFFVMHSLSTGLPLVAIAAVGWVLMEATSPMKPNPAVNTDLARKAA